MPDYGESSNGVKLAGVREGSPAEKGGLKAGDVIVKFAGKPVSTIQDYMENLSRSKPGDTVELGVRREGKDVTVKVTLGRRPSE
jgi:S1-C subfamily serine protease